jgi:hypothetical protein
LGAGDSAEVGGGTAYEECAGEDNLAVASGVTGCQMKSCKEEGLTMKVWMMLPPVTHFEGKTKATPRAAFAGA